MARKQDPAIREFILQNIEEHPESVAPLAAEQFGLSRTGIARYMTRLIEEGIIVAEGKTRARRYALKLLVDKTLHFESDGRWTEDTLWREHIRPLIIDSKQNIIDILQYGVTEMINNVIDHSDSPKITIYYEQTYTYVKVSIRDYGIGIFNKIENDFHLADPRTALLELSKGKLTSDRRRHSGEGIYFTSRMFDKFSILSGHLYYSRIKREGDDWIIESIDKDDNLKGTYIRMIIHTSAEWTMRSVFDKFQGDDIYFRSTHLPIALGRYPGEQLISRSQAKRILARVTEFAEVMLDFRGINEIGQPFADEIFRVFQNDHPGTRVVALNTNESIDKIIRYVQSNGGGASVASPVASRVGRLSKDD